MENLVSDLMDLAKLENDSFNLSQEYFNLGSTVYEAFQILITQANSNKIQLRAQIDEQFNLNLLEKVYGDQQRFLQILLNFLSNSIKFTNKGGMITVDIKVLCTQVRRSISDNEAIEQAQNRLLNRISKQCQGPEEVMEEIKREY